MRNSTLKRNLQKLQLQPQVCTQKQIDPPLHKCSLISIQFFYEMTTTKWANSEVEYFSMYVPAGLSGWMQMCVEKQSEAL